MSEAVKLILSLSVSGGLFALVLFALKPFIRHRLPKSFQYYIWFAVLLRFILPFSFGINLMEYTSELLETPPAVEITPMPDSESENPVYNNPEPNTPDEYTLPIGAKGHPTGAFLDLTPKPLDVLPWIWLAGMVLSVVWNVLGYLRFIRRVHGTACAAEPTDCGVKVYKSRFAPTPMLIGLFKPRIILPEREYTTEQLQYILLHEHTHLRRHDMWLKWFVSLVVSVHWFNPIVYLMRREINRACELACDEAVIRKLDGAEKQSYGDTLIDMAADTKIPAIVLSTTLCDEKKKLKERLVSIMKYKKKTKAAVLFAVVLAVVLATGACAFGAGFGAKNRDLIEFEVIYTNITEYSQTIQFKNGDILYSTYIIDNEIQSPSNWSGFKVIGYAADDFGEFRIFERKGYSVDEFIVVQDYGFMNGATIYAAEKNSESQSIEYDISLDEEAP